MPDEEPPSKKVKLQSEDNADPLAYTKTGEFTSEVFKIIIRNIPLYISPSELKKIIIKQNLDPVKIKRAPKTNIAFVTFRDEDGRLAALEKLSNCKIKNRKLEVAKADPKKSPFAVNSIQNNTDNKSVHQKTSPLYDMKYDDQLELKIKNIQNVFDSYKSAIKQQWGTSFPEDKYCFVINEMKPSPTKMGYRNKCEFTVGVNVETQDPFTVGFVKGRFSDGNISVEEPFECLEICPKIMMNEVRKFKAFIESSGYPPYNSVTNVGVWKALEVRTNSTGHVMITMIVDIRQLSEEDQIKIASLIKENYGTPPNDHFSVFLKYVGRKERVVHILGLQFMTEELCGFNFQITSGSFFQVNSGAAGVLYQTIRETAELDASTILLDVCCGTGTIGIILSKYVAHVHGIELVESAVKDAKQNAEKNNVSNITFYTGNAKVVTPRVLKAITKTKEGRIVAVVDPPRGGLHADVISCLRNNEMITELVYVSCDIDQIRNNIVNLCRPSSNKYGGLPFQFIKAVAVDLFPHTRKFEVVFHFKRDRLPSTMI